MAITQLQLMDFLSLHNMIPGVENELGSDVVEEGGEGRLLVQLELDR